MNTIYQQTSYTKMPLYYALSPQADNFKKTYIIYQIFLDSNGDTYIQNVNLKIRGILNSSGKLRILLYIFMGYILDKE